MKTKMNRLFAILLSVMLVLGSVPMAGADNAAVEWSSDNTHFLYNGQSYDTTITVVDPTCEADGYTLYEAITAEGQQALATKNVPGDKALGHDWDDGEITTAPTCVDKGIKTFTCQREGCGAKDYKDVDPTGVHTPGEPVEENRVDSTCTKAGSYDLVTYCTTANCKKKLSSETKTLDKLEHNWVDDAENSKPATCKEEGVAAYKCNNKGCKETKTETIKKLDHVEKEPVQENVVKATCTEDGSYDSVVYCENCGDEISRETIPTKATGHKVADGDKGEVTTEPTCEEAGVLSFTCTVCGEAVTEPIDALGHDWQKEEYTYKEATCEEDGLKISVEKCSRCEDERNRQETVIPATGEHEWELTETVDEATCTSDGWGIYTCKNCSETKEDIIEKLKHTPGEAVNENIVDATCLNPGSYDEVVYCTACGGEISREQKNVPALGHDWVKDEEESVAPTCTKGGKNVFKCSRCGETDEKDETDDESLKATGHDYVKDETASRDATCKQDGEYIEVCSVCKDVHKETIKKETIKHTPGEAKEENVVKPTCTKDGSHDMNVYCTVCGIKLDDECEVGIVDEKLGHDLKETITKAATCTETGLKDVKCQRKDCDYAEKDVVIEALGHDYIKTEVTPATCTQPGRSYGKCSRCEDINENIVEEALGHEFADDEKFDSATVFWADNNTEELASVYDIDTVSISGHVEYVKTCTRCKGEEDQGIVKKVVDFDEDDLDNEITVEPECGKAGEVTFTFESDELSDDSTVTDTYKVAVKALEHKGASPVKEKVVDATCTEPGSYESVVYCEHCEKELSRDKVEVKALGHDWDVENPVIENEVNKPGTEGYDDTKAYEYDLMAPCKQCDEKSLIKHIEVDAKGHNPAEAVKENEVEPTCTEPGSYDMVIYCKDDGEELDRTTVTVNPLGHDYENGKYAIENETEATCTEDGEYDSVIYCGRCGEEILRDHFIEWATGHEYTYTVVGEIIKQPSYEAAGTKADVTYCATCREKITETNVAEIPALEKVDTTGYLDEDVQAIEAAMEAVNKAAAEGTYAVLADAQAALSAAVVTAEKNLAAKLVAEAQAAQKEAEEAAAAAAAAAAATADERVAAAEAAQKKAEEEAAAAKEAQKKAEDEAAAAKAAQKTAEEAAEAAKKEADEKVAAAEAAQKKAEEAAAAAEAARKEAEEAAAAAQATADATADERVAAAEAAQKKAEQEAADAKAAQKVAVEAAEAAKAAQKTAEEAAAAAKKEADEKIAAAEAAQKTAEEATEAAKAAQKAAEDAVAAAKKEADEKVAAAAAAQKVAEDKAAAAAAAQKAAEEKAAAAQKQAEEAAALRIPAVVNGVKLKAAKKALTASWTASSDCDGYEIQVARNKKFTKDLKVATVTSAAKASQKVKKLLGKKTYYVRIRAYKVINGGTIYGDWSKPVKVKTKK